MPTFPNYPSNSHKSRERKQRPSVEAVANGSRRQSSARKKFSETFVAEDSKTVGSYILYDVLIPAAKSMVSDVVSEGIERLLFGDTRSKRVRSNTGVQSYTSYNQFYKGSSDRGISAQKDISRQSRATHDFGEIILDSRGEAELVLDKLDDLVNTYDLATVSDLYDLVGVTGSFTDEKWGWYDLSNASCKRVREGYLLELPRPVSID